MDVVLVRHGETEWSRDGRHTGRTDVPLTARGEEQARAVGEALRGRSFALVLSSPLQRALETARLAGFSPELRAELAEWDYGDYEGLTSPEIDARRPGWQLWSDGCPGGESPAQMTDRIDRFITRLRPMLALGDVAVISHGHASRSLAARWVEQPVAFGAHLMLGTATISILGHEHDRPALRTWNTAS
jgi:probable phosphoglycerate mutase